jgi:hypothetical protein
MIILRPYEAGDIRAIEPREYEKKFIDLFGYEFMEIRCKPEWSFTTMKDGKQIAVGGIWIYWQGMAEVFLWLSPEVVKYPIYVCEAISIGLESLIKQYKLRRVQTVIDANLPINIRFCEFFGFRFESRLTAYDPWGNDGLMYVRFDGVT